MPEWTREQKKAIDSRGGTILVSAAAGSGKTAVLVERIIKRLMDTDNPCSADRLLIVTFTRAATQQMKDRIFRALSDEIRKNPSDEHLKKQAVMLPFANISTIDGFCNDIVRENFQDIDIAPDYGILDSSQLSLMQADAVSQVMDEMYKENSPDFIELVNTLSGGTDDKAVTDLIMKIYNGSQAFARPDEWLDGLVGVYDDERPLREQQWGRIIVDYARECVEYCLMLCIKTEKCAEEDATVAERYGGNIAEIREKLNELFSTINSGTWDDIRNGLLTVKFGNLGRLPTGYASPQASFVKSSKTAIADHLKKTAKLFCASEAENAEDMKYLEPVARKLICAVRRYGEILSQEKKNVNAYDFSDICHFALDLLVRFEENGTAVKTRLAESLSEKYVEILVDEYQDVNDLQNTLFRAVSRNSENLFTVGDVKQSIYRFRQAMPEIFLRERDSLEDYKDGNYPAKITLDRNFRSRRGVTENINFLFSQIMSREMGSIDYNENEALVAAADYEPCDFPQTELCVVGDLGRTVSREDEAQVIADKINSMIAEKMTVRDKDGYRSVSYRDFCILMRSANDGKAELYADVLAKNNIPAYVASKSGFFASPEISMMLSLMRITDNSIQDVPLLAVMLSPIFGFTPDELARLRISERRKPIYHCVVGAAENGDEKCIKFLEALDRLRMLSATLSCSSFILEMLEITGFRSVAAAMKDGAGKSANLNMLVDYATKYEESGRRGLTGFIRFIDRIQRQNGDLESAGDVSEAADVVHIMTIHKSKGLEFPVCIIADLSAKFNDDFSRSSAAYHPDYGICFDRRDQKRKCKYATVGKKALGVAEKKSGYSEELRVLYVAMTRAKEKLICVARYNNIEKKLSELASELNADKPISPFTVISKGSAADWVVTGFLRHPDAACLWNGESPMTLPAAAEISVEKICDISSPEEIIAQTETAEADEDLLQEIKERVEYEYPYSSLSGIMAKSAPSDFESDGFSTEYFASAKPQFLSKSGVNPASRGTATHKFMEFFDYTAEKCDIDGQIERMLSEHHLTTDEAKILERGHLRSFFDSELAARIKKAPLLLREKKVTVGIRAGDLYSDVDDNAADEMIVIQGYVDCAFEEDGKLVIVDYKTDRNVDDDTLRRRYGQQLKMYEYALHECTGMEIKGTVIYSFGMDKAVDLD